MRRDARQLNSMSAKAATMLFIEKGAELKVYLIGLRLRKDRAA